MRILFIGDIVGESGRLTVAQMLPRLTQEHSPDIVIANGENVAGGIGITKDTAMQIFQSGVDVLTMGNHVWSKRDVYPYLDQETRIVRPANYPADVPGRGWEIYRTESGESIGVINLCGRVFMDNLENPFKTADAILETLSKETKIIFIDFHGEATSEKIAFAWHMDGRVSAIAGTHTHVQTADECILPEGTAYITDAGMTGPINSVIGVKKELVIHKFLTQMPTRFEVATGETILSGVVIDVDSATGKASNIKRLRIFPHRASTGTHNECIRIGS